MFNSKPKPRVFFFLQILLPEFPGLVFFFGLWLEYTYGLWIALAKQN